MFYAKWMVLQVVLLLQNDTSRACGILVVESPALTLRLPVMDAVLESRQICQIGPPLVDNKVVSAFAAK